MNARAILMIANGCVSADLWVQAATEHRAPRGRPKACSTCPLRRGGKLEEEARRALGEMCESQRRKMAVWGCHDDDRPCAGMRRLLQDKEPA